jgi:hypothetical protein
VFANAWLLALCVRKATALLLEFLGATLRANLEVVGVPRILAAEMFNHGGRWLLITYCACE